MNEWLSKEEKGPLVLDLPVTKLNGGAQKWVLICLSCNPRQGYY